MLRAADNSQIERTADADAHLWPFCGGKPEVDRDTSGSAFEFGASESETLEGSESKARGWQRGA